MNNQHLSNSEKKLLDREDVRELLKIGKTKMQELISLNVIPFTKVGSHYYITETDFYKWISSNAGKVVF